MSLINDALKRASQSEKQRPRDTGLPPAMQPVPDYRRSNVPMLAGVAIVALLAAAGWFFWRSLSHRDNPAPAPVAAAVGTVAPAPPAKVEPAPAPAPVPAPAPAPAAVTPPPNTNPPAPEPAPAIVPAPAPAPPPFPDMKLQGIFYSRSNPRAAINGEIHGEKELVGEVRIVTIASNKVTVEWNGQTKDLNLGGQ